MTQNKDDKAQNTKQEPEAEGGKQRKEKVLHTRIPTVLEQELKALAKNLRVPVSNLVRTILSDALTTAEALGRVAEDELRATAEILAENRARLETAAAVHGDALRASLRARDLDLPDLPPEEPAAAAPESKPAPEPDPPPPADPLDGVLGFQEMMLAVETKCSKCGIALGVGEPAFLGVRATPGPQVIIGPECVPGKKEQD